MQEVEAQRHRVKATIGQIQNKLSPGQMVDELLAYAKNSGGGDFVANFGKSVSTNPIPVALLARLAIDRAWQGRGLGRALFRDGAARIIRAADSIGIRGIVVHAISEQAKAFYLALGCESSPLDPMTLMVTLSDVRAILGAPAR